ncbi:MAG: hypothetical protein JST68_19635 [Bacteroidetes bacterium]|nr:hypothetical protein [Bacteroidota bacterium]
MNALVPVFLAIILWMVPFWGQAQDYDPNRLFTVGDLRVDLDSLKSRLERMDPGLYRYSTRKEIDGLFDSLSRAMDRPMDEQAFLSLVLLLNEKVKNGHTMFLPSDAEMAYRSTAQAKQLPFSVSIIDGRLYVRENCSVDGGIETGTEILRVNGLPAQVLLYRLMVRLVRDGYNTTYPKWILGQYFAAYFSFVFGRPEEFVLDLKGAGGEPYRRTVRALARDSIEYFRRSRYRIEALEGKGIVLEEKGEGTAVLTIRSFNPDILLSTYQQEYKQTMDSLFRLLEFRKISNLVLDLRDNQGGDFPPMRHLLSYLVLRPVRCILDGEESRMIEPAAHHYKGKLLVLINGGSFSATAITSALLEKEGRGHLIGEETGGNKYEISGNAEEVVLPQTKIRCYIPTVVYKITEGKNNGHGVYPEYYVAPEASDIGGKRDRAMEMAMKLIRGREGSF